MQETKQAFRRCATQAPIPDTYSTNLQDMAFRIAKGHKTHRKTWPFARQYATFYNSGKVLRKQVIAAIAQIRIKSRRAKIFRNDTIKKEGTPDDMSSTVFTQSCLIAIT